MNIIRNNEFQIMLDTPRLGISVSQRKKMKDSILMKIEDTVNIRWSTAKKVRAVIDDIVYKLTDRGFSFAGRLTLADKLGVKPRTVDNAIKHLKASNLFYVCYRENTASNGAKTPVFILKDHPNFAIFNSLLYLECNDECDKECEVENAENTYVPTVEEDENTPTYSLSSFTKQENNNKYNTREIYPLITKLSTDTKLEGNLKRIVEMLTLKVSDALKKGVDIQSFSSYCEKVFWNEFRKFNAMKNSRANGTSVKSYPPTLSKERMEQINASLYAWI